MKPARLVAPSVRFKQSFIEAVREFQADDYRWNAANGGTMEDEIDMGEGKPAKQRFWIDLS